MKQKKELLTFIQIKFELRLVHPIADVVIFPIKRLPFNLIEYTKKEFTTMRYVLNVESDGTEVKSISLTGINGKNVYQKNTTEKNITIDLDCLKSGTYIIKIMIVHEIISRIIIEE